MKRRAPRGQRAWMLPCKAATLEIADSAPPIWNVTATDDGALFLAGNGVATCSDVQPEVLAAAQRYRSHGGYRRWLNDTL